MSVPFNRGDWCEVVAQFDARIPGEDNDRHDVCQEYAIVRVPTAMCNLVVYARSGDKWEANPWNERAVIRWLLMRCGLWKGEPPPEPQWKDAPDAAGFWWWWKEGIEQPELYGVDSELFVRSFERFLGSRNITSGDLGGRWLPVVRPQPPKV